MKTCQETFRVIRIREIAMGGESAGAGVKQKRGVPKVFDGVLCTCNAGLAKGFEIGDGHLWIRLGRRFGIE